MLTMSVFKICRWSLFSFLEFSFIVWASNLRPLLWVNRPSFWGIFIELILVLLKKSCVSLLVFWWPLFLALKARLFWHKVTFIFLNVLRGWGGGPPVYEIFLFWVLPFRILLRFRGPGGWGAPSLKYRGVSHVLISKFQSCDFDEGGN